MLENILNSCKMIYREKGSLEQHNVCYNKNASHTNEDPTYRPRLPSSMNQHQRPRPLDLTLRNYRRQFLNIDLPFHNLSAFAIFYVMPTNVEEAAVVGWGDWCGSHGCLLDGRVREGEGMVNGGGLRLREDSQ